MFSRSISVLFFSLLAIGAKTQFIMDMVDTSSKLKFSGYIQPQYQYVSKEGAKTYSGGDFSEHSNSRFMLRRGRVRLDYVHNGGSKPSINFVIQLDGTERGVFIRDLWGRLLENKFKLFSLTAGMFARPFGYEVNLSSAERESPERGRMSQTLMKAERDLGAMVSLEDRTNPDRFFRFDVGLFNGQGLTGPSEYDSKKDLILRLILFHPQPSKVSIASGISVFRGGLLQAGRYKYSTTDLGLVIDSVSQNKYAPRNYISVDAQIKIKHHKGSTEFRGEYWNGTQTGTKSSSETPINPNENYYVREFDGAFFYLLHFFDKHNQIGTKYEWYDPNLHIGGLKLDGHYTGADVRYKTLGFGYLHYIDNFKVTLWYDLVRNEHTNVNEYTGDLKDNVLTCRFQYRF